MSAAVYATTSRGAFSCAANTRPITSSPSATRTRKPTNGNWDSHSSSDGAAGGAARLRLGARLVSAPRRTPRRGPGAERAATGERVVAGRERAATCDRAGGDAAQDQGAAHQEFQRRGVPRLRCSVVQGFRHAADLTEYS